MPAGARVAAGPRSDKALCKEKDGIGDFLRRGYALCNYDAAA
jgi:hypothetical protein